MDPDQVLIICLILLIIIGGLSGYALDKRYNQRV